jgi:hypothetical protein
MAPAKLPDPSPPCPDGEHSFYPHDHALILPLRNPKDWCSGRFWCVRCNRWFDGDRCKLAPAGKAA